MTAAPLQLLDVHQGTPPPWWPLAPGWWVLVALACSLLALWGWRRLRRHRRRAHALRLFDDAITAAPTPQAQVATMSELLRRAARRVRPGADVLDGEAWLALLDEGFAYQDSDGKIVDARYPENIASQEIQVVKHTCKYVNGKCACGRTCDHKTVDADGYCTFCHAL